MFKKISLKVALLAAVFGVSTLATAEVENSFSLGFEVGYDSNVYSHTSGPLAERESVVYKINPKYVAKYVSDSSDWSSKFTYSPVAEFFAAESTQDNQKHNLALKVDGKVKDWDISLNNKLKITNTSGDDDMQLPTGYSPFLGGYVERDRKDGYVLTADYKAIKKTEKMLYRAVMEGYYYDWRAQQNVTANPGYTYINHVDRSNINIGADIGYKVFDDGYLYVGYRYGYQWQGLRPANANRYTNTYHRLLVGKEGTFMDGKLTVDSKIGVDFKNFKETVAAGFDDEQPTIYVNSSSAYKFNDEWSLKATGVRYGRLSSTGGSFYDFSKYALMLSNKTTDKLTLTGGFTYMGGDWFSDTGVARTDRLFSPSFKAAYKLSDDVMLHATYIYEDSDLEAATSEHTRHYIGFGADYKF